MAGRYIKNQKITAVLLSLFLCVITVSIGLIAVTTMKNRPTNAKPSSSSASTQPSSTESKNDSDTQSSTPSLADNPKTFPEEMRAVYFNPGKDYLKGESQQESQAKIDKMISSAKDMTMNTIVIATDLDGKVIYPSKVFKSAEIAFDPIEYIIGKAKEVGLYTYIIFPTLQVVGSDSPHTTGKVETELLDSMVADIRTICDKYKPNGIMVDGYYNVASQKSYSHYLSLGGAIGFENYMSKLSEIAFNTATTTFRECAPWLHIGMLTEPVWANSSYNKEGSKTSAGFTALYTGNSDNKKFIEYGYVDFVAVKATGSTEDQKIPYKSVVAWWADVTSQKNLPLYVIHSADKAGTDSTGWTEYDQLTRQIIESKKITGFSGSMYNSYTRLEENPKDSAGMLVKYYNNQINPNHVMTDLAVTKPAKSTYTTFEPSVTFSGASDPNTSITINSQEVNCDKNGYFNLTLPLDPGLNEFDFYHKGKTVNYNITRQVKVVKEVSPGGTLNLDGGMKITVTATAYSQSKVVASLGGKSITLSPTDEDDETNKDSDYKKYEGTFTLPNGTTSVQKLGNIVVSGTWNGFSDSMQGATVNVNKRLPVIDGNPVVVVANPAPTYPPNNVDPYGDPSYYPIPKGAKDYAIGNEIIYTTNQKVYTFFKLQSGLRVNKADIASISEANAVNGNEILGLTVTADKRYTNVILNMTQQTSYKASYDGSKVTFDFKYTASVPKSINLNKNPIFSAANWSDTTLVLPLVRQGCFMGFYPYYDDAGNLVLRFNNPPSGINGSKIVIDPGHGGKDPGSLGFLASHPEKVVNFNVASKLTAELENRGATVVMLNTFNNGASLEQRVSLAQAANPHLFISVHSNSILTSTAYGSEAYHFYPFAANMSTYAAKNLAGALGTTNRGGRAGQFYVTRTANYPAVLLETGFMSNENEYSKLVNSSYQSALAEGIANAVASYFASMDTGMIGTTGTQTTGKSAPSNNNTPNSQPSESSKETSEAIPETPTTSDVKVTISPEGEYTLEMDSMLTVEGGISPENSDGEVVMSYKMSNEDVAEVEVNGNIVSILPINSGTITVTATLKGSNSVKAVCKITIPS